MRNGNCLVVEQRTSCMEGSGRALWDKYTELEEKFSSVRNGWSREEPCCQEKARVL